MNRIRKLLETFLRVLRFLFGCCGLSITLFRSFVKPRHQKHPSSQEGWHGVPGWSGMFLFQRMLPEVFNFGFSLFFYSCISICFGSRDMLRSCLETKEAIPRTRDKAAKKKTAFGLNFDLHQCQVRRGDLLLANRSFPVLLGIDLDLNSFFFEARFKSVLPKNRITV